MNIELLIQKALEAREKAYAPYSNFHVGSAILTKSGKIFTGCNVENSSYSLTICAERTAISKAISEGEKEFEAVVIISDNGEYCPPCGACRQVISEFGSDIQIIIANNLGKYKIVRISELLPLAFEKSFLNNGTK